MDYGTTGECVRGSVSGACRASQLGGDDVSAVRHLGRVVGRAVRLLGEGTWLCRAGACADLQRAAADEPDCAVYGRSGCRSVYARAARPRAVPPAGRGAAVRVGVPARVCADDRADARLRFLLRADARAVQLGRLPQPERPRSGVWSHPRVGHNRLDCGEPAGDLRALELPVVAVGHYRCASRCRAGFRCWQLYSA
jgi:hypothetical protein